MSKKTKVKGHTKKTSKGIISVAPYERKPDVSFNSSDSGKLRPSVHGLQSKEDAAHAANIIKAFKAELSEED